MGWTLLKNVFFNIFWKITKGAQYFGLSNLLRINSISCKISMLKIGCKLMMNFKSWTQNWCGGIYLFFKCLFFLSNMHHSFSKLERILILNWNWWISFKNHIWMPTFQTFVRLWKLWILRVIYVYNKIYSFLCVK